MAMKHYYISQSGIRIELYFNQENDAQDIINNCDDIYSQEYRF